MNSVREKILKLPKGDVHNHLHLGGSRELLKKKYPKKNLSIPLSYNGLEGMISFIQNDLNKIVLSEDDVVFLMENAIKTSIEDNVTYLEASIDIGLVRFFDNSIEKLITSISKLKNDYRYQIDFRPDIGINKEYVAERIYTDAITCVNSKVFNGIDIYGKEENQKLNKFVEIFSEAKKEGLKTKVHIGEFSEPETIEKVLELLRPQEIQHGIKAADSDDTIQLILEQDIQLNICPQSNLALGAVKNIKAHPIRKLFDNGIRLTINTDDYLLFNASITNQFLMLIENNIFSFEEINQIRKNALLNNTNGID
jgi:adenosine deaminase